MHLPIIILGVSKGSLGQLDSACLDFSKAGELGLGEAYDIIKEACNQVKLAVKSQNNQPKSFHILIPQHRLITFFLGVGCVQCSIILWLCVSGFIFSTHSNQTISAILFFCFSLAPH